MNFIRLIETGLRLGLVYKPGALGMNRVIWYIKSGALVCITG